MIGGANDFDIFFPWQVITQSPTCELRILNATSEQISQLQDTQEIILSEEQILAQPSVSSTACLGPYCTLLSICSRGANLNHFKAFTIVLHINFSTALNFHKVVTGYQTSNCSLALTVTLTFIKLLISHYLIRLRRAS